LRQRIECDEPGKWGPAVRTLLLKLPFTPMNGTLKILTVDDQPSITESMRFIFPSPKYEVTGAQSGDDALEKLEAKPHAFDVIIIDQKMPHLSGVELVEEIRRRQFTGRIMVLSAHLTPEIRAAYEEMNVQLILEKPFDIQELRVALDRLAA
jgi:DNA-binding response OmpR family regulator